MGKVVDAIERFIQENIVVSLGEIRAEFSEVPEDEVDTHLQVLLIDDEFFMAEYPADIFYAYIGPVGPNKRKEHVHLYRHGSPSISRVRGMKSDLQDEIEKMLFRFTLATGLEIGTIFVERSRGSGGGFSPLYDVSIHTHL
jgi:hypothetical protein